MTITLSILLSFANIIRIMKTKVIKSIFYTMFTTHDVISSVRLH